MLALSVFLLISVSKPALAVETLESLDLKKQDAIIFAGRAPNSASTHPCRSFALGT